MHRTSGHVGRWRYQGLSWQDKGLGEKKECNLENPLLWILGINSRGMTVPKVILGKEKLQWSNPENFFNSFLTLNQKEQEVKSLEYSLCKCTNVPRPFSPLKRGCFNEPSVHIYMLRFICVTLITETILVWQKARSWRSFDTVIISKHLTRRVEFAFW